MPFDFKAYDAKCNGLTPEELQREWEHYTRLISGASTSTAISGIAVPFTLGVSTIGVAMAAPAIHNARKKRAIIEKHLQKHNATHVTRKRDVFGSMAVSGTIGIVTLGVGSMGADAVANAGAEHGISAIVENETAIKVVTHAALDGVGMGIEHAHTSHLKKKDAVEAFQAAGVFKAVENAKAAEAGYSFQPYNPQNFAPGGSMSQISSPPPPPPPYTPGSQRLPSYYPTPNHAYASGSKSQAMYMQSSYDNQSVPANTGQYSVPQPYDPNQVQFQQSSQPGTPYTSTPISTSHTGGSYIARGAHPTHLPQASHIFPSPPPSTYPQTALQQVQQAQQVQTYQPQQPLDQFAGTKTQTLQGLPSNFRHSSISGAYDMKVMTESLPVSGTDQATAHEQQKPRRLARKPVPTSPTEKQPQVNPRQSPSRSSQPIEQVRYLQDQPINQASETPQVHVNQSVAQSQSSTQQDPQLNQTPQMQSIISQSSSLQPTEEPRRVSPPPTQQCPTPPSQEPQVDISSLCGLDLTAPQSTTTQASIFQYGEVRANPSPTAQQQSYHHEMERPAQETHQQRYHEYPEQIHQQYPSAVAQQQTGCPGVVPGQQTPIPSSQTMRYSLQPSLYPIPLLTPSPQISSDRPQSIPYFPPPPGQPQSAYNTPPTFPPPPSHPSLSSIQPPKQSQKYTTAEVKYPPVPIPGPYSQTGRPTSFYGQMSPPDQSHHQIPLHSKPQQQYAPPAQYHTGGYSQMPLTPPYSPPQVVEHTGSGYFSAGTNPQFQNMYPAHYQ